MELARLNLDTYKVVQLLETKGYSKEEAEGFIEAIKEITLSGVATKEDISDLNIELRKEISDVKKDLSDVRKEISDLGDKFMRFVFANTIAIVGIMIAIQFIPT